MKQLIGVLAAAAIAFGQLPLLPDTACLRYRFTAGDTLIYRVEAQDSILLGEEPALVRERYETLMLLCDSVDADGTFWLRLLPIEFLARERQDTLQALRPESPCLHRPVLLRIDSLGRRLSGTSPARALVCPGGPFALPFLLPLAPQCVRTHESWLVQDSLELWENGFPPPRLFRTSLLRLFPQWDTLGYRGREIQHVTTSQGWFVRDSALTARSVGNAFGRLLLSADGIPVWAYTTQELRLSLTLGGVQRVGLHYSNEWYRLQELRSARSLRPFPRR
jgi:hypothetical protein